MAGEALRLASVFAKSNEVRLEARAIDSGPPKALRWKAK
jgi:hypothetical protein